MDPKKEIPCVFQIPLEYGDDHRPVEEEKILQFFDILNRRFGGYTPLGRIEGGSWHGHLESQLRIEVWVAEDQVPALETVVRAMGRETRQKEMFLIVPKAEVYRYDTGENDAGGVEPG